MMTQFDPSIAGSLDIAQTCAIEHKNTQLEPIHLVYGLVKNPQTKTSKMPKNQANEIASTIKQLPTFDRHGFKPEMIKPSSSFGQWITYASAEAIQDNRSEISERDLRKTVSKISPELEKLMPNIDNDHQNEDDKIPPFLINLNELAAKGKLDPVIGRTKEIRAVMEILGRRSKNNPVLVGEAGVGKTAVVEGLADMIFKKQVPDAIKEKTVWSLDMGSLMAGTKFRGEFEERIQSLLRFIKAKGNSAILFIDELHQLVGAGKTDGPMDAANLLKPALARGDLACIGATTQDEFRRYILSDSALERRFRAVPIGEPMAEHAIEIMMGLKEKFEIHHGIDISEEAIYNSVFLSNQYINDKNLPDKAIDLIDEAASALKLSAEAMPADLAELEAEIRTKIIFSKTKKSDDKILDQINQLQQEFNERKEKWEKEVLSIKKLSVIKSELDKLKFKLDQALSEGKFEVASEIKYADIPQKEQELKTLKTQWTLTKKDIANVISRQTGIPVEKILRTKQENLLHLPDYLKSRVIGQDTALQEISETLMASHAGLNDQSRPLGSFMLLGPSGVGKTETAKALAQFLFNEEKLMRRFDMSEFSEKHAVAKLIGSPPGYVGYEDGGILTEAVRKAPYSVLLFDEIEKAHPDFADILLQILDDGRLSDNKGRIANFQNTIVVMTSNSTSIETDFKPEVLGRIDGILTYSELSPDIIQSLVMRHLAALNKKLQDRNVQVEISADLAKKISQAGFDQRYGARPLANVFARLVTRPLSKLILQGDLSPGVLKAQLNQQNQVFFS